MKKSAMIVSAVLGLGLMVVGGVAACKQGEGERCQVESDCDEGLLCTGEGVCKTVESGQQDAQILDAPIDAPVDAAVDAP